VSDRVADSDLLTIDRRVRALDECGCGYNLLFDGTGIEKLEVTGQGVFALATAAQQDSHRVALVTAQDAAFGMARMYEICTNWKEERVRVFRSVGSALKWLDGV
jgi:hypothetical protein